MEEVDEREIFMGSENTLTMKQTYTHEFQCSFKLAKYPFDGQTCSIEMTSTDIDASTLKLLPKQLFMEQHVDLTLFHIENYPIPCFTNSPHRGQGLLYMRNLHVHAHLSPCSVIPRNSSHSIYRDLRVVRSSVMRAVLGCLHFLYRDCSCGVVRPYCAHCPRVYRDVQLDPITVAVCLVCRFADFIHSAFTLIDVSSSQTRALP